MRGKILLVSAVIALVAFSGVLFAMTSEEVSKLPLEERMKLEEEIRASESMQQEVKLAAPPASIELKRTARNPADAGPEGRMKEAIIGTRSEDEKAVLVAEGFEGAWPPTGWTIESTAPADSTWHQEDYDAHTGIYSAGVWWSWMHQDEWLKTPSISLTGSASGTYWLTYYSYVYRGSIEGDHYYLKISTDGGSIWTTLGDFTDSTGGWDYFGNQYNVDLSAYAGEDIIIAWHGDDGFPSNTGLWYIWLVDDVSVWYPLDHDVGVTAIYEPVGTYLPDVSVTPSIEVENFGGSNETFDATFKIFNGTKAEVYSETQTVTVTTGATQTVDFTAFTTAIGSYTTLAYTDLVGDEEPSNDTLEGAFDVSIVVPEDTISFHGAYDNNAVGLTAGGTYEAGIRITPTELAGYDGWQIASVIFYHHEAATHACAAKIYEGGTPTWPGALITEEPYSASGTGWHRIYLTTPVMLDTGNDIWVSVEVTHAAGEYPIGIDAGPAVQGKGDWIYYSGGWEEMWPIPLDYNWILGAVVELGIQLDHDVAALSIIEPSGTYTAGTVVAPKTRIKNLGINTETFDTYFNIYDGTKDEVYSEVINTTLTPGAIDTLVFPDFTVEEGSYEAISYTDLDIDENPANDTAYSTFGAISFVEDFESGDWPPYGWETYMTGDVADNHGWQSLYDGCPDSPNCLPYEGDFGAWHQDDNVTDNCEDWLVSPLFSFDPGASISFYHNEYFGSWYVYHGIWVSTGSPDPADGDFVEVNVVPPVDPYVWELYGPVDLSAYSGLSGYIAFKYEGDFADHWYIDYIMGTGISIIVPEHDIEVNAIISPAAGATDGDIITPQVVVVNRGNTQETFPVSFEMFENGTSIYYDETNPTVDPGAWDTVAFTTWLAVEGTYTATAIASCPGDVNPLNDTLNIAFSVYGWYEGFDQTDGGFDAYNESGSIGWQWGAPTSGPGAAHSGEYLWATVLAGDYENYADYRLEKDFYTLSDEPVLSFYHWYDIEGYFDGGNVKISTDGGTTWQIIYPDGDYPEDEASSDNEGIPGEPCYTGSETSWQIANFDLSSYVNEGDVFFIRWHFGSDVSDPYPGWYIDDVSGSGLTGHMPYDTWVNSICSEPGFDEIQPGQAVHLCAVVENNPIGPVANFRVYMKVINSEGNIVYSSSEDVRNLEPRGVRTVWFSTDWVPAEDTYTLRAFIQNAFEPPILYDNNVMEIEVTVGGGKMAIDEAPEVYFLSQSYPNPAMGRVSISYGIPKASRVDLMVYDITGRVIKTLVNREETAGYKNADWNLTDEAGKRVARGIYFYKLSAGNFKATKKLIVIE